MKVMSMVLAMLGTTVAWGAPAGEVKNLPAGGTYVFEGCGRQIQVNCTAQPAVPSVLSRFCACNQYDQQPYTGVWKYRLSLRALLSSGETVETSLVDGLSTVAECEERLAGPYAKACAGR